MLWIGSSLGPVERACMRSIMAQGHALTLYHYQPIAGVPAGVTCADAAQILPQSAIVRHSSGSVALFSDRFRFALQQRGLGVWLDADVYLLKPIEIPDHGHVFGLERPGSIASGVLRLPGDSPISTTVADLFNRPHPPPWLRRRDRIRAWWRRLRSGNFDLGSMPWGVCGPMALSALAQRHGLDRLAASVPVYYPWSYLEADWIFDPAQRLEDRIRPETRALHLYNFMIADRKNVPALPGSFMARLQQEGA